MTKIDLARKYIKKFPNTPSLSLARKLYQENNESFKDIENARTVIRQARGLVGKKTRERAINKELFVKPNSLNPFNLPKSFAEKPKTFFLPKNLNNVLVLSDIHIPYHDIPALTVALDYGKNQKIDCIFINGDLVDFYQISRFVNVERKRSVKEELDSVKDFLQILKDKFNVPVYLLMGNHDNRLEHYLATKAPELLDCEEFKLEILLEADKYNLTVLKDSTLVRMGKLNVTHGHLLIRGVFAPVNSARGAFMKAKASVLIGHVHKVSTHSETTINGKVITCYSTGSLCELTPTYSPFANNYQHGFAHVTIEQNGHYKVRNLQIIDGELIA